MTLAFELPPHSDSILSRLDPRWKLASILITAAVASAISSPMLAGLFFCVSLALAALGRVPLAWYLRQAAGLCLILLLFGAALPFVVSDSGPSFTIGPVEGSWRGLRVAVLLGLKALTILTFMLTVLATAPLDASLKAAHCLHVPGLLIQLCVLTYRYVFLLADELVRLMIALRVRGYRLRPRRQRFHMLGLLTGTMLVRGYERAERVGQAMRCRGFNYRFRSLTEFHTRPADVVTFLVIVAGAAGMLGWDFLLRAK